MLIALLAILGVDLMVIVVLAAGVLARRRWIARQPGAFRGAIRLAGGEFDGLGSKWRKGYARWVRDVLVWTKAPFLLRNELVPADRLGGERTAAPGEVKRLGGGPIVLAVSSGRASVEIAASGEHRDLLLGPHRERAVEPVVKLRA
jgi:Protein of unknown function (DUF2550)